MKPTVTTIKSPGGRHGRINGYRAKYGALEVTGGSPKQARAYLEKHVVETLDRLDRGTLIGQWRGHTYVIAPDTSGWRYWVDVFSRPDYWVTMGTGGREEALDDALSHLAKTIWHRHMNDTEFVTGLPPSVQKELLWYFNWQRAYVVAIERGETDETARAFADTIQQHTSGAS